MTAFDPIWNELYSQGHRNRYPWDAVVSFVFRNAPRDIERNQVEILEVACGTAGNLWFAAREGFSVSGIDGSTTAIEYAKQRFVEEGLTADLRVADFTSLPFEDAVFHLAIDRAGITCCAYAQAQQAVAEVHRTLKAGGKFFFNVYSVSHTSAAGKSGLNTEITQGNLTGVGAICFYTQAMIMEMFPVANWHMHTCEETLWNNQVGADNSQHAEWRVVVEKK